MNPKIFCPNCRSEISLPQNGQAIEALACYVCGQSFMPRFYCPDAKSNVRHTFVATTLLIDNEGGVYTFCPEHTFTTYALVPDSIPLPQHNLRDTLLRYLDSIVFRLTLEIETLRLRVSALRAPSIRSDSPK